MKKALNALYLCSCGIVLFFFGYVFLQATGNTSHMEIISFLLNDLDERILILLGAMTILAILVLLNRILSKTPAKRRYIIMIVLLAAGLVLQLFMIFVLRPMLQYDSLKPVDVAMHMLDGKLLSTSIYYDYFTIYPYNLSLVLFMMIVFKAAAFVGIAEIHYVVLLQFINCLLLDFSVIALYCLIGKKLGEKRAITFFLLCLLNPLMYYYPVFFYTKVLAGPLMALLIYMFFLAKEAKDTKHRLIYGVIYGVVLFYSIEIRTLSLIAPVACVITLFLTGNVSLLKKKTFWAMLAAAALTFMVFHTVNEQIYERYGLVTDEDKAFPVHHWFMMGLKGNGKFDMEDFEFTNSFSTKEERAQKNTEVIIERIKELGPKGLISLWGRKLTNTWSDGYDDYADNLANTEVFDSYKDYLVDDRAELLAGYMHMYHCLLCFLAVCAVFKLFYLKQPDMVYTMSITIVGGMIFHLFWESSETYSMPFALLIVAVASAGLDFIELPFFYNLQFKKHSWVILAALLVADLGFCHHLSSVFYGSPFEVEEWAVNQNQREGESIKAPAGSCFTQTALVSRSFNNFTTFIKCDSDENIEAKAVIWILGSSKECLYEQLIDVTDNWYKYSLDFDTIVLLKDSEVLTIEISVPEECGLEFLGYNTGNWDVYHAGSAAVDGVLIENADLSFSLSNRTTRTFLGNR